MAIFMEKSLAVPCHSDPINYILHVVTDCSSQNGPNYLKYFDFS